MTKVKMVMVLILAVVVAGGVFAQKASGDTYNMVGGIWGEKLEESEWNASPNPPALLPLLPGGAIKNNAIYKVTVTGTSDKPLKKLRVVMSALKRDGNYDPLVVSGWNFPTQSIAAKKPFTYTTVMPTVANAASMAKGLDCRLSLDNLEPLTKQEQKGAVMATLTNVKVAIEEMPEGTYFMIADIWKDGNGEEWQGNLAPALSLATVLPKGVKNNTAYKITVTGTSDKAMTKFRACMINEGFDSLTGWKGLPELKVDAKKPFTYTASLTTTANASSMAKDLKRCFLYMSNPVDGAPKDGQGDLTAILTNVKVAIEEVK